MEYALSSNMMARLIYCTSVLFLVACGAPGPAKTESDSKTDASVIEGAGMVTGSSCTQSQGRVTLAERDYPKGYVVAAGEVFDGGCKTYRAAWGGCDFQSGAAPAFRLEEGATLKNVIIDQDGGDGIHVYGNATIENVSWPSVCGQAVNVKGEGTVLIKDITAYNATDDMFRAMAKSEVTIKNAILTKMHKAVRENGGQCFPINWRIEDAIITDAKEGVVFRSDCYDSQFSLKNVTLIGIKKVCRNEHVLCAVE